MRTPFEWLREFIEHALQLPEQLGSNHFVREMKANCLTKIAIKMDLAEYKLPSPEFYSLRLHKIPGSPV